MATISDQLAASIQQCFNQTYTDLANQQSIFFGSGDVTLTKPDGSKGTVRSWNKLIEQVDPVIKNAARKDQDTTFSSMLMANKDIKSLSGGLVASYGGLYTQFAELSGDTPYIDFHYNKSTSDYTHRIIAYDAQTLTITSNLATGKDMYVSGYIDCTGTIRTRTNIVAQPINDPNGGNGSVLAGPALVSQFNSRGSDSNGNAGCAIWYEEYVGSNHKLVIRVQGYTSPIQYWQFTNNGQIYGSNGQVQWAGTSDVNYKKEVKSTDGKTSLDNICAMELVTFIYKDDEQERVRRGVIAQQIRTIDEAYVKESELTYQQDDKVITQKKLVLDSNPLLMDALAAIQVLARRVEELEKHSL